MKKIIIFLFLFCMYRCFSQPSPPPSFKVEYSKVSKSKDSLLKKFEFRALNFKDSVNLEEINKEEFEGNDQVGYIDSSNVWIFIYSKNNRITGNVFRLSIKDKNTDKIMSVYIRIDFFSKTFMIKNLIFKEGDYFYDAYEKNKNYQAEFIQDNHGDYILDILNLRNHKISIRELTKNLQGQDYM